MLAASLGSAAVVTALVGSGGGMAGSSWPLPNLDGFSTGAQTHSAINRSKVRSLHVAVRFRSA